MKTRAPRSQPASKRAAESTTRSLESPRERWAPRERFRSDAIPLLQAALAAGLAWFVARDLVGHTAPIFAPIGALLILSNAPGRRTSRVLAATLGAVIGIAVGDLLVSAIGTGAIQVAVVALLAMSATAVLGASPAVVTNAGIAAVLIATVQPAHGFYSPAAAQRLVDVLIGGATSLAVLVLLPAHSLSSTRRAATAPLVELSATLDEVRPLSGAMKKRLNKLSSTPAAWIGSSADCVTRATSRTKRLFWRRSTARDGFSSTATEQQRRSLSSRSATCASSFELAYARSSSRPVGSNTPKQSNECGLHRADRRCQLREQALISNQRRPGLYSALLERDAAPDFPSLADAGMMTEPCHPPDTRDECPAATPASIGVRARRLRPAPGAVHQSDFGGR